jgi:hypothetical protein
MVLTRSQSRLLALEKEMNGNKTSLKKETKTLSIEKEFIDNVKKMLNDHAKIVINKNFQTEKIKTCIKIFEYVNKMIHHFKNNKKFNAFIKCVYEKCLSLEKEVAFGVCDKLPYKLVCDLTKNIKKCKEIIINDLEFQV